MYKRGKAGEPMQFGRLVLLYEDGAGFITHYYILPRDQSDRDVVVQQTRKAQRRHRGRIRRASFDRGFHSPDNQEKLGQDHRTSLSAGVRSPPSGPAGEDGKRRVPRSPAVAPGHRVGDWSLAVGQWAGALSRPDRKGICTLHWPGRVGAKSSCVGQVADCSRSSRLPSGTLSSPVRGLRPHAGHTLIRQFRHLPESWPLTIPPLSLPP